MMSDQLDALYEEQFNRYLLIAKSFVQKLRKPHEKQISSHWIQRLTALTQYSATVGKDRNYFFQYFIKVLQDAVVEDMSNNVQENVLHGFKHVPIQDLCVIEDPGWLENQINVPELQKKVTKVDKAPYFAHWSSDQKTYIAAKTLPGKGALVYMAVSTEPDLGWSNLAE